MQMNLLSQYNAVLLTWRGMPTTLTTNLTRRDVSYNNEYESHEERYVNNGEMTLNGHQSKKMEPSYVTYKSSLTYLPSTRWNLLMSPVSMYIRVNNLILDQILEQPSNDSVVCEASSRAIFFVAVLAGGRRRPASLPPAHSRRQVRQSVWKFCFYGENFTKLEIFNCFL